MVAPSVRRGAVGLLGVGLLRVLADDDLAVEAGARRAPRMPCSLWLPAVRLGVVDRRVVVDQPIAVGEVEPVQRAVATLAVEERERVVADELAAEREGVAKRTASCATCAREAGDVYASSDSRLHIVVSTLAFSAMNTSDTALVKYVSPGAPM